MHFLSEINCRGNCSSDASGQTSDARYVFKSVVQEKGADVNRLLFAISATALSALLGLTSIQPATAAPISNMSPIGNAGLSQSSDVIDAQYRRPAHRPVHRPVHGRPGYGRPPYHHRPAHPIHRPGYRPGYWHGYHGYHYARPGYRRYNDGLWYPLAAFGAGAVVGGAIATQPAYASSHVLWCANRYRTYRASDNTYQPNSGPRAQCVSP